jgi:hypothetical protein
MEKEIRSDAKLKNLPAEMQEDLWRLRNPADEDEKKSTYVEVLVWLKGRGIDSSLGALSEFYSWQRMSKRMESAKSRAQQAREELAKDPSATPESVARVGQMVFTAEMVDDGNVKAFVELEKLRLQNRQLDLDLDKFRMIKAKADRLDAMEAKAKELKQGGGLSAETLEMLEKQLKIL